MSKNQYEASFYLYFQEATKEQQNIINEQEIEISKLKIQVKNLSETIALLKSMDKNQSSQTKVLSEKVAKLERQLTNLIDSLELSRQEVQTATSAEEE